MFSTLLAWLLPDLKIEQLYFICLGASCSISGELLALFSSVGLESWEACLCPLGAGGLGLDLHPSRRAVEYCKVTLERPIFLTARPP